MPQLLLLAGDSTHIDGIGVDTNSIMVSSKDHTIQSSKMRIDTSIWIGESSSSSVHVTISKLVVVA